jgi:hypothetical protein
MARHCGFCYGRGHNKRTCPNRIESILRRYKSAEAQSKEFYRTEILKLGISPETGKPLTAKEKKARTGYAKQERLCTYCGVSGHNARTCSTKKSDITLVNEAAKEFRIAAVELIKSEQFPQKGTLLQYHSPREWMGSQVGYQPVNEIHMVTGVEWDRVTFDRANSGATNWLTLINLAAPGSYRSVSQQSHWRVDKERRNNNGKISESGWAGLSNPPMEEVTTPEPPPAWWNSNEAGGPACRLIAKGERRNSNAMRIFTAALAAVKDGRDIDMTSPRLWAYTLDTLGLLEN